MNRKMIFVSVSLVALLGALALAGCAIPSTANNEEPQPHTITVNGNGVAYGTPDIATAQIGVQVRDQDPVKAVDNSTDKMHAIMAALKELGIEEKDIQTTNFSVYAQQDYDPKTGQPKDTFTYVADNTLTVTIRDLSKVGQALGEAVKAGANNIYGVSFSVDDPAKLEAEARDKAMADAKVRAEQLAKAAGVTLDVPMNITEYISGPVYPVMREAAVRMGGGEVPVSSGQIQISLQVSVTYIIK
ncbi:MAG: SIMPL domain-containing protein [Anaerolineae bacterium]|jgi:uncharacterized protein YggE|nr:SIMPL domain-containing protein [Anaerolineae bacterium]MDH7473330.1 SIMPL domain-containing protein [Anaerolineae bacterium]